jgi:hypothetical protein
MIPRLLTDLPQWVVAGKNKKPINARTLHLASVTDSRTWSTYEVALATAKKHKLYVGFVLIKENKIIIVDLDKPKDDEQRERHTKIFNALMTYTETSISGNGLHLISHGNIPQGIKRDQVEVYDSDRYFIITGDILPARPRAIHDCSEIINQIVAEMGRGRTFTVEHDEEQTKSDEDVLMQCANSANGDKFKQLWAGDWQRDYGSQSEADFAMLNFLAFATHNNEQTRKLFRMSELGRRDKAERDPYLNGMIGQIRAEQNPPPIDFSQFKPPAILLPPRPVETTYQFPPGLIGEIAQYIHDSAIKPIPQIALAGALGLVSGIAGRTYNISNTGLNMYFLIIAGTAIGKEGAAQGMDRIMAAVSKKLPSVEQFIGPGEYASGQALVKQLEDTPCMVSKMGEFGHMLKRICNPNAIGADVMWRKLFLELFNKSGPTDKLGRMVYSDQGKNTAEVVSPAFSIVADSTASSVFENLSEETIEIGLIPRFMIIECTDKRPPTNPDAWAPPSDELVARVEALAIRCLSMSANGTRQTLTIEIGARRLLKAFDEEIDGYINAQNDDAVRQIWSRSYLKAVRVAGILSVGMDVDAPNVTVATAEWAIEFARTDAKHMLRRFGDGVGGGDPEQVARLRNVITNILTAPKSPRKMSQSGVVSHQLISQRAYALACFKTDRMGAGNALNRALNALMDNGEIIRLSGKDTQEQFSTSAKCYWVTNNFQSRNV